MSPLSIVMLVLLFISGAGLIVFILLHSGKGTGVSDMIQSSFYSTQGGTSIVEKNLDRITIVLAIVFFLTLVALMFPQVYPQGTIGQQQAETTSSTTTTTTTDTETSTTDSTETASADSATAEATAADASATDAASEASTSDATAASGDSSQSSE